MVCKKTTLTAGCTILLLLAVSLSRAAGLERFSQAMPAAFERNQGQADSAIRFLGRTPGFRIEIDSDGSVLCRAGDGGEVRIRWVNGNIHPDALEEGALPARMNYYRGHDPSQWHTGVPLFQKVGFREIYPGIDLFYQIDEGGLEYGFGVRPGSDPQEIRMRFSDGWRASLNQSGELELDRNGQVLRHRKPLAYQIVEGRRVYFEAQFWILGNEAGLRVADVYDSSLPLVIDPTVDFSFRLGGTNWDAAYGVASDGSGNVYITGETNSSDFPGSPLGRSTNDVFVTKVKDGTILYTTILASGGNDAGRAIAVDGAGNAYVVGTAGAANFPVTTATAQAAFGGSQDAFLARLDNSGHIIWATFLGGGGVDAATGVALDAGGSVYVTGYTASTDFPTTAGSPQRLYAGGYYDAFVAKLRSDGSQLVYGTLLGGGGDDVASGIGVDRAGNAIVVGATDSRDFPVSGALQSGYGGNGDAFIASLNPAGSQWNYVTYFGGSGSDLANGVAVGSDNSIYVTGAAYSIDFPVSGSACQRTVRGGYDAFVSHLTAAGTLIYSTLLGGSDTDNGTAIAVDSFGQAWVGGYTLSVDFPTRNPMQSANRGSYDAFIAQLDATGSTLLFATYWGGVLDDRITGVAFSPAGALLAAGQTASSDFPTTGLGPPYFGAGYNAFVTEFNPLPGIATMISPAPGSSLGLGQAFSWTAIAGADAYWLDVGSGLGLGNYFAGSTSGTGLTVNNLPCGGAVLYVQLWTHLHGSWQTPQRYQYTAFSGCAAVLTVPTNGTAFTAATVTFAWSAVAGADSYWLDVGSAVGVGDYLASATTATGFSVSGLPCNGRPVYAQLWTHIRGGWQPPQRNAYVAASGCAAALTAPANGAALAGSTVTFSWNAAPGADQYWLDVGSAPGLGDYFAGATTSTGFTIRGLPCDSRLLYAQLWTHSGTSWKNPERYSFTSWSACGQLTTPAPGTALSSGAVQFTWTAGTGVTAYWLDVGTIPGQGNIFAANVGGVTSRTVAGIPTTGNPIYVQLWSMIGGTWCLNRYSYAPLQ